MKDNVFCHSFYLLHESGDHLFPIKVKNKKTGEVAFRVSKGGNTIEDSIDITDEAELKRLVVSRGYSVRAATLNKSRKGLFKLERRSIVRAVVNN